MRLSRELLHIERKKAGRWITWLAALFLTLALCLLTMAGESTGTDFTGNNKLVPPWPDEPPLEEGPILTLPQIEPPTRTSWVWVTGEQSSTATPEASGPVFEGFLSETIPFVSPEPELDGNKLLSPEDRVFAPDERAYATRTFAPEVVTRCCPTNTGACRPRPGLIRGLFANLQNTGRWQRWVDEPGSAGVFLGYGWGTELVNNWLEERDGFWGGVRLGWDLSEQYGVETRLSFGSLDLWDHPNAVAAATERRVSGVQDRWVRPVEWDVVLLYYPTENDPWRPYVLWGVGLSRIDFADYLGTSYEGTYFTMPLGIGLKFRPKSGPVMRFELVDQIVFPSRFNTTHHFAFTVGLEMRFGKRRKIYWPWESASW